MEILGQVVGGVVHEQLGVLQTLGIAGEIEVDQVGVAIDLLEGGGGLFGFAVGDLLAGFYGHPVDEFGVEVALLAGARLTGAQLELGEGFRGGQVGGRVEGYGERERREKTEGCEAQGGAELKCGAREETKNRAHESPRGDLVPRARLRPAICATSRVEVR